MICSRTPTNTRPATRATPPARCHPARETGQTALALQPGQHVLEIGFGTGNSILDLANTVGANGHVCGIDVSPGMLEVATKKIADAGLGDRVELQVGDARELPYPDASFDAAFTSFTLELFPLEEIPGVLAQVSRVLKPGGRLGVVSMASVKPDQHASMLEKTYIWMHQHFPHIVDCQPIDAAGFVQQAGLQVLSEQTVEIWSMPVAIVVGEKKAG